MLCKLLLGSIFGLAAIGFFFPSLRYPAAAGIGTIVGGSIVGGIVLTIASLGVCWLFIKLLECFINGR